MLAVPHLKRGQSGWAQKHLELEQEVEAFWNQFEPAIVCDGVEPLGTDEITLADIEPYQRFDADWVSFERRHGNDSDHGRHEDVSPRRSESLYFPPKG